MRHSITFPEDTNTTDILHIAHAIEALRNMGFTNDTFHFLLGYANANVLQVIAQIPDPHPGSSGYIYLQSGNALGGGNTGHIHIQTGRGKAP